MAASENSKITSMTLLTPVQLNQLVGNRDVYAVQEENGQWFPVYEKLTMPLLVKHLKGDVTIGTYVVKGDQAKTLVFDSDDGLVENPDGTHGIRNHKTIYPIHVALRELGVPERSIGIEFSGSKGYHVWVLLGGYVLARDLRRLGRAALALSGVDCEVFPKQDRVEGKTAKGKDRLGNLVKLPGALHRVSKKRSVLLTPFPKPMSKQVLEHILSSIPEEPELAGNAQAEPFPCVARILEGVSEGGRNNSLYHAAVMLRRGGVPDKIVDLAIREARDLCDPPDMTDEEIEQLLESSKVGGPICDRLSDNIRCDPETCVCRREKALFCRPGQLRHAAPGEKVVVEMGPRVDRKRIVDLLHPDGKGKVQLYGG